jgi:CubicO group peptidase (beta-lactamase class C family)
MKLQVKQRMKKWISALIVLTLLGGAFFRAAGSAAARMNTVNLDAAAVDAFVKAQMKKHNLPGVAVAITQGEEIVYLKSFGTAGGGRAMTPQTPLYIGSISKPFTALAVMQLVEQGKIDLNAPVQTYLPWFVVADAEASRTITIRNLLNHTSGLSDAGFDRVLPPDITREEAVRTLSEARLTAPVGNQTQYFNLNFTVLSLVVETVTGQSFEDYLQENIFDPLDMGHTYTSLQAAQAAGLAYGHTRYFGVVAPRKQEFRAAELGAGFLISSVEDMAHFMIAQYNDGQYEGTAVLSAQGVDAMHRRTNAQGFAYGMGWFINEQDGYRRIEHGGSLEGFKSDLVFFPERQTGFVILINQGHLFDAFISRPQLTEGLAALLLGKTPNSQGLSMNLLAVVLAAGFVVTVGLMVRSLRQLPKWKEKAALMSRSNLIWEIGSHFLIPTLILIVIASQVVKIFGDRFNPNLIPQVLLQTLPDMGLWMLVGTLPDYGMGIYKLVSVLHKK